MDTHLVVAVVQLPETQGIVKVLGVRGIYGKGENFSEVFSVGAVLVRDFLGDLVGCILHRLFKAVGKAEFGQDGVHLGFVLSGHTQNVHHVAVGARRAALPAVHYGGYLHTPLSAFRNGDGNVVGHSLGAHKYPGLLAHNVQHTHKGTVASLDNGYDFSAAALVEAALFLRDGHTDCISVEGTAGFGGLDKDVFFLPLNAHKGKSLAGHQYFSLEFGNYARLLVILPVGAVFAFGHKVCGG